MRFASLLFVLMCSLHFASAQQETANWFLSSNRVFVTTSGISNNPVYANQIGALFSSTSISDSAGNLLFACDGSKIFDRNLQVMPFLFNDAYHLGAQKVLAVKMPASTKYYVFYTFKNSSLPNVPSELYYSVVDLSLNGGKGDIIAHEVLIASDVSDAFTLARSPGTDDAWLVTHRNATDTFVSYKVTAAGLSPTPVISQAGTNVTKSDYLFQDLKTSHNGLMIAGVTYKTYAEWYAATTQFIETFHFDGATGKLHDRVRTTRIGSGYFHTFQSLAFSPDDRLLYLGNMQRVYGLQPCGFGAGTITQYNLCYSDSLSFTRYAATIASKFDWCNPSSSWGRLQMGADKRIYTVYSGNTVSAINHPNRIGTGANFQSTAITLPNINSGYVGIPSFYHALTEKAVKNNIVYEGGCFPAPTVFRVTNDTITSIHWNFGDPASPANTSVERTATHQFSGPGTYTVTATLFNSLQQPIEVLTEKLEIKDPAKRLLHGYPRDTIFCTGQSLKIKLQTLNGIFAWSRKDGSNNTQFYRVADSIELESAGTYYVEMRQNDCNGCIVTDSIKIRLLPVPYVNLGYDRDLCTGDSLTLSSEGPPATNTWSTGATTQSIQVRSGGVYWVTSEFNNNGCPRTDSVVIKAVPGVHFSLPPDTTLCNNETLLLSPGIPNAWYTWQDGSTTPTFEVKGPGKYWVRIMNQNYCWQTDTINVHYINAQQVFLGNDTLLCAGDSLRLSGDVPNAGYLWSNGSAAPSITVKESGTYWVRVVNGACVFKDTINVTFSPPPVIDLGKDTSLCVRQTMVLRATVSGASYEWQDGSTADTFKVTVAGKFWVTVKRQGCSTTDTIVVAYRPLPVVSLGPDKSLCGGANLILTPASSGSTTYTWQDGSTGNSFFVQLPGTYWVEAIGSNGCFNRDTVIVQSAALPQFTLGADTSLCTGQVLRFSFNNPGATYLWSTNSTSHEASFTAPGTYWLEVTQNGCVKRDSILVLFKPLPVINLGADTTLCEGISKVLSASFPGAHVLWNNGSQAPDFVVNAAGIYHVTASLNGCSFRDTVRIQYALLPQFTLGPDLVLCKGQSVKLEAQPASGSLLWQDGSSAPSLTVTKGGTYTLSVTNSCGTKTDAVQISEGHCALLMPDAFTPNRDGVNDIFRVKYPQFIRTFQFQIFNRWGEVVYASTDPSKGWDGTWKGLPQPTGNFIWQITLVDLDGKSERHTGSVFLIR